MTKMNHIDPGRAESRRPKPDASRSTALAAFQAKNAEIAAMLARLQALSAADFEMKPKINETVFAAPADPLDRGPWQSVRWVECRMQYAA